MTFVRWLALVLVGDRKVDVSDIQVFSIVQFLVLLILYACS